MAQVRINKPPNRIQYGMHAMFIFTYVHIQISEEKSRFSTNETYLTTKLVLLSTPYSGIVTLNKPMGIWTKGRIGESRNQYMDW